MAKGGRTGSAIVSVLAVLALLSMILVGMLHGGRLERRSASLAAAETQARLAADSASAAAMARLLLCTSNHPAFVVGLPSEREAHGDNRAALVLSATNLHDGKTLVPLISSDLRPLAAYPSLPSDYASRQLSNTLSTNPDVTVDLNAPGLSGDCVLDDEGEVSGERLIAPEGRYAALWQPVTDSEGKTVARYAFVLTDEAARLNPALHRGAPRSDPLDWDRGPGDLPLTNAAGSLLSPEEAGRLTNEASWLPIEGSFAHCFDDPGRHNEKKHLLTRDPCLLPDVIPAGYPEGGLPKYNLNDLATNPAWGETPTARATNIAAIIDRNLPSFKLRDPSLPSNQGTLYLQRLACSVVDYISRETGPTALGREEPTGRDLVPYVTQVAERTVRKELTPLSVTIESRFFAEVWNPTTSVIPAGGVAELLVGNRARLRFGTGIMTPFRDYHGTSAPLPAIRPNELLVIAFSPQEQSWTSPTPAEAPPSWDKGPQGNADPTLHQPFLFRWNGKPADRTRPRGLSPGDEPGGLMHMDQKLTNNLPTWQCSTVPTSSSKSQENPQDEADEAIATGSYRAVGDPRQTFLTSYIWQTVGDYRGKTRWKGINPAGIAHTGYLLDPASTWTRRDCVPVNPVTGVRPTDILQSPDLIPSPYEPSSGSSLAPSVIRKGPMNSIGELGNIYDPAQADDLGEAPVTGGHARLNPFGCGGGRTLRIGQPEFHTQSPKRDWDVPGKRAVDLLDIFTVKDEGRHAGPSETPVHEGIAGRINVNTAPHPVLAALFTGVAVTSDRRFTNSVLSAAVADRLATLIEEKRPFNRLSDLAILTPELTDARSYLPALSRNVPGSSPPVADVVDRAREEAFGKIIGHCAVQSRTFRITAVGQALDASGKPASTSVMEGIIRLRPDAKGQLVPSLHDIRWR